jgi:hypothetical protein
MSRALRLLGVLCVLLLADPACVPEDPTISVWFDPPSKTIASGCFDTDVMVSTNQPLQAFELDLEVTKPELLALWAVSPHDDFDDDGGFLFPPSVSYANGTAKDIVDLRHGISDKSGLFRIATVRLCTWPGAGTVKLRVSGGGFANPLGEDFATTLFSATITVQ